MADTLYRYDEPTSAWTPVTNINRIEVGGGSNIYEPVEFEIEITAINTEFKLNIVSPADVNVNWGDGFSVNHLSKGATTTVLSNIYSSIGTYTITISGYCENFSMNNTVAKNAVKKINNIGTIARYLDNAFKECIYLTDLSNVVLKGDRLLSVTALFYGCSGLTSIPQTLMENSNITDVSYMFYNCSNIASIPSFLFNGLNISNSMNMFSGCSKLTSLPDDLFNGCLAFYASATYSPFKSTGVTSISPYVLRGYLGTSTGGLLANITGITSVPSGILEGLNITDVSYMFYNCSNIASNVPDLWNDIQYVSFYRCYYGCTKASNYASIPATWK